MATKKALPKTERNIALCYIRKSWTRDETDQISPERQRSHIQATCEANGWKAEWYEDTEGHRSGMFEKNRPGWLALKARLGDPDVIALVANDLARLHRKGWRIGDLLDYVEQRSIRLVLADPRRHIDFSTPYGRMFAQLSAIFDEWYATDISERWKASIAHRKSKGITVGRPPFGTKRDKKTGFLIPSDEGAWLLPDGMWIAGKAGDEPPSKGSVWRGYFQCAERILKLYAEQWSGREKITRLMQSEGWAYRDGNGSPSPLEVEDIRRVTNNWPEYGGIVIGKRARERSPLDYDPDSITLNPERAVFDVELLMMVGRVQKDRTRRAPDRGYAQTDYPYPLSGLTYCAHCERVAQAQNNPKLRSRLGGKSKSIYRHKAGASCGCTRKSVMREVYEADFLRLMKLLTVKPEMIDRMQQLALQMNSISAQETEDIETKRSAAIAKCQRRIEAARHLYEDGDISRQEYIRRRELNEKEIQHWKTYTSEAEKLLVELAMCIDVVDKIVRLWEVSDDEDKQGMVRHLFEQIVYDLDSQRIVDFQLKDWVSRFLVLRKALYDEGNDDQSGLSSPQGIKGVPSPVRAIGNHRITMLFPSTSLEGSHNY
jgi:DNA invertase Pin-like site-specific DNA recombinase